MAGGSYFHGDYEEELKAQKAFKHSVKQTGGDHYEQLGIQPREIIRANKLDYFEGRALTYLLRWRLKGNGKKDLQKCKDFIDMMLEDPAYD